MVALGLGAVDVMVKPHGSHSIGLDMYGEELIAKVVAAAGVNMSRIAPAVRYKKLTRHGAHGGGLNFNVVIIGSSTGGPRALRSIVPELPADEHTAYVVVQHLPKGFSGPLAEDLNRLSELEVRECSQDDELRGGEMLIARSGYHCIFDDMGKVRVTTDPPVWGVRPSVDVTMISAVPYFGSRLIGVLLTGMGRDGAEGMRLIKKAGGATIAEHKSSCVVYGMPRVAIESGIVDTVVPLGNMVDTIITYTEKIAHKKIIR